MTRTNTVHLRRDALHTPRPLEAGWTVWNAPRPLVGEVTWEQTGLGCGWFFAAGPADGELGGWRGKTFGEANERMDAAVVVLVDDENRKALLNQALEDGDSEPLEAWLEAGFTVEDVAQIVGMPW